MVTTEYPPRRALGDNGAIEAVRPYRLIDRTDITLIHVARVGFKRIDGNHGVFLGDRPRLTLFC